MAQGPSLPVGQRTLLRSLPVNLPGLPGPVFTQMAVPTGETALPAANKAGRATVSVKALAANGAAIHVGLTGLTATSASWELSAGDSIDIDADDTVMLKILSVSGTQRCSVCEI